GSPARIWMSNAIVSPADSWNASTLRYTNPIVGSHSSPSVPSEHVNGNDTAPGWPPSSIVITSADARGATSATVTPSASDRTPQDCVLQGQQRKPQPVRWARGDRPASPTKYARTRCERRSARSRPIALRLRRCHADEAGGDAGDLGRLDAAELTDA